MQRFRREDLERLIASVPPPCVSLFMPIHRPGSAIQQDQIRLKNLLRDAEEGLVGAGVRAADAKRVLEPALKLLQDDLFWRQPQDGLVLFVSPAAFRCYRLPLRFDELVVVGQRFHLTPLLPLLTGDGRFYILALSQHVVRLLEATRRTVDEVSLEGIPGRLEDVLQYDVLEKQLHVHARVPAGKGTHATVFHGHGFFDDDSKEKIRRYFQQVERGVHRVLREEHSPLVLAGVDYLLPIYREVNTYPHLLDGGITRNAEGLRPEELREHAWALVEPYFAQKEREAADLYRRLAGTGRTANDVREAVPAAYHGRIDRLFVAVGARLWGAFDPEAGRVDVHPVAQVGDHDLVGLAAIYTLLNRGTVYAVDPDRVPDRAPLAAIYRY